jgi:hypothetical protein
MREDDIGCGCSTQKADEKCIKMKSKHRSEEITREIRGVWDDLVCDAAGSCERVDYGFVLTKGTEFLDQLNPYCSDRCCDYEWLSVPLNISL